MAKQSAIEKQMAEFRARRDKMEAQQAAERGLEIERRWPNPDCPQTPEELAAEHEGDAELPPAPWEAPPPAEIERRVCRVCDGVGHFVEGWGQHVALCPTCRGTGYY
jgi:hypothetical protein